MINSQLLPHRPQLDICETAVVHRVVIYKIVYHVFSKKYSTYYNIQKYFILKCSCFFSLPSVLFLCLKLIFRPPETHSSSDLLFFPSSDLIQATQDTNVNVPQMADTLLERVGNASWVVVFKALITTHHLMVQGNEVRPQCRSGPRPASVLSLHRFIMISAEN